MVLRGVRAESESCLKLLKQAKHGDVIEICKLENFNEDWLPHPGGVVVQRDNKLLLNGDMELELASLNGTNSWRVAVDGGIVVEKDGSFQTVSGVSILETKEYIFDWAMHPRGIILEQRDGEIAFNGQEVVYKDGFNDWHVASDGSVFVISGHKIIKAGIGVLFEHGEAHKILTPNGQIMIVSNLDFLLDRGTTIFLHREWECCASNDHGLYIEQDGKIFLHVFNK